MTTDNRPIHHTGAGSGLIAGLMRRLELRHERRADFEPRAIDPQGGLRPITHSDFLRAREQHRYLKNRWPYYREAIAMASRLAPRRVLEIGCRYTPLFPDGDRLDYMAEFTPTIVHDATVVPWPVADQAYDLVIALQVWEHLGNRQREAFSELPRIARYAILSLPYKWRRRSNPSHSGIDDAVVSRWSGGLRPLETVQLPLVARHKRKIYLFDLREAA
ncbi:MAG: hypothetical protein WD944_00800 [Steroidobacteraceae bacterium]